MNEHALFERLRSAADALPPPTATTPDQVRARAASRRRRRAVAYLAALPLAVLAAIAVLPGLEGARQVVIGPVLPDDTHTIELAEDAIWHSPPVDEPRAAVRAFADTVLGWPDAAVDVDERLGPPSFQIRGPVGRTVTGQLSGSGEEGVYALTSLRTPLGTQQPDPWTMGFRPPDGAVEATVYVRADGRTWPITLDERRLAQGEVTVADHGVPDQAAVRSALILYRDRDGVTIRADGGRFTDAPSPDPEPSGDEGEAPTRCIAGLGRCDDEGDADVGVPVGHVDGIGPAQDLRATVTDDGVCFPSLGAGSCTNLPNDNDPLGARRWSQEGAPNVRGCNYGAVDAAVRTVEVEFHDGTRRSVPTHRLPILEDVRVYATCWSGELQVESRRGLDHEGNVVATTQ